MQKINLYTVHSQDNFVFDNVSHLVNLIDVDTFADLWQMNGTVIVARPELVNPDLSAKPLINDLKKFLDSSIANRVIINDVWEFERRQLEFLYKHDLTKYSKTNQLSIITCGMKSNDIKHCVWDIHVGKVINPTNLKVVLQNQDLIYSTKNKPYTFTTLNGRPAPHRIAMIQLLAQAGVLDNALWSLHALSYNQEEVANLYDIDFSTNLVKLNMLPEQYENWTNIKQIQKSTDLYDLNKVFGNDNQHIKPESPYRYIDTYFTVITETDHDYYYTPPAEKIYRPMLIGHPFIAIAAPNFYKDLHDMGFKTFGTLIDESFDTINNHSDRLHKATQTIISLAKLSKSDLDSFLSACKDICDYNREHMMSLYGKQILTNHTNLTNFLKTF
jgi:hypothetical protein